MTEAAQTRQSPSDEDRAAYKTYTETMLRAPTHDFMKGLAEFHSDLVAPQALLSKAASHRRYDTMHAMMDAWPDVDATTVMFDHLASFFYDPEGAGVDTLKRMKAHVPDGDKYAFNVLMEAIRQNKPAVVDYVLDTLGRTDLLQRREVAMVVTFQAQGDIFNHLVPRITRDDRTPELEYAYLYHALSACNTTALSRLHAGGYDLSRINAFDKGVKDTLASSVVVHAKSNSGPSLGIWFFNFMHKHDLLPEYRAHWFERIAIETGKTGLLTPILDDGLAELQDIISEKGLKFNNSVLAGLSSSRHRGVFAPLFRLHMNNGSDEGAFFAASGVMSRLSVFPSGIDNKLHEKWPDIAAGLRGDAHAAARFLARPDNSDIVLRTVMLCCDALGTHEAQVFKTQTHAVYLERSDSARANWRSMHAKVKFDRETVSDILLQAAAAVPRGENDDDNRLARLQNIAHADLAGAFLRAAAQTGLAQQVTTDVLSKPNKHGRSFLDVLHDNQRLTDLWQDGLWQGRTHDLETLAAYFTGHLGASWTGVEGMQASLRRDTLKNTVTRRPWMRPRGGK